MAQDIRDMFREEEPKPQEKLNKGHQQRFKARLKKELPVKHNGVNYFFLKIAALFVIALGLGFFYFNNPGNPVVENEVVDAPVSREQTEDIFLEKQFQLSDISPEFKKIENFYLAGINMELAKLEVNNDNKALINAFMLELEELDKEYQRLNEELQETGPNEQTIEAMLANLQLRMDLLRKLKTKLNELKESKNKRYDNLNA